MPVLSKKGIIKFCWWICFLCLSWVWESQHASTGNSVSWSRVIVVDPAFIAGHQSIKNWEVWSDQLDHLLAVITSSFFLIFPVHAWDKLRANTHTFSSSRIIECTVLILISNCALIVSIDTQRPLPMNLYLVNQLWFSDILTPPTPCILHHRLPALLESLMPKTDVRFMQDGRKAVWSNLYVSVAFFVSLNQNFIAYRSSKLSSRPDWIYEIHQLC